MNLPDYDYRMKIESATDEELNKKYAGRVLLSAPTKSSGLPYITTGFINGRMSYIMPSRFSLWKYKVSIFLRDWIRGLWRSPFGHR